MPNSLRLTRPTRFAWYRETLPALFQPNVLFGTVYKKVTQEEFIFQIRDIHGQIPFVSSHLKLGEKYRVVVAGQSADGCDTTTTRFTGVVDGENIAFNDLLWATTAMGCLPTP